MQHRDQYTKIEDFLEDESFRRWVHGQTDPTGWAAWSQKKSDRAGLTHEARLWLLAMGVPPLPEADTQQALDTTWEKIREADSAKEPAVRRIGQRFWWGAAAAILIAVLSLWQYNYKDNSPPTTAIAKVNVTQKLIRQANQSDRPQLLTLSDGTSVLLSARSVLHYPQTFDANQRVVTLEGEGFFEVSKDPGKPFVVYAGEIVTRVVGTSFRVKAYGNQPDVEVIVKTGRVSVSSQRQAGSSVILLPNQRVKFMHQEDAFDKVVRASVRKEDAYIEQTSFDFTDTPVAQIVKSLERAYLVEIDFPAELLRDCNLTTSLNDQPLPEKLKIICESLGERTRYEMNGTKIRIFSPGCD